MTSENLRSIVITPSRTLNNTRQKIRDVIDASGRVVGSQSVAFTTVNNLSVTMHQTRNPQRPLETPPSFTFPFAPQAIDYSGLSPELQTIDRPGKQPIVAFSRFRAKQIAIKFLIAVPNDGLHISVDGAIELLTSITNSARPVYFTNMDKLITNPLADDPSKNIFWSIIEMSLSSLRRNETNAITAAEATLSLVENTNPEAIAVELPRIDYTEVPPVPRRKPDPQADLLGTWTDVANYQVGYIIP